MDVKIVGKNLVVTLPLESGPSKSGKSTTVASTRGNRVSECVIDGKPVVIGLNAYIKI